MTHNFYNVSVNPGLLCRDDARPAAEVPAGARIPRVSSPAASAQTWTVLVFSHRPEVREALISAVGRRPAPDLGRVTYLEVSGIADVLSACDAGTVDLAILDGEAQPTGGMGLARQLKDEITDCPPVVVAVRRADDRWLATWSQAEAVLVHPLDPLVAAETVADVLRGLSGAVPAPTRR
jgi:DNA-binding response OmpR family regulator